MIKEIGELLGSDGSKLLKMWEVSVPHGKRQLIRHSHICFEITLITDGCGIYTVGDIEYAIKPGEIFVFASNEQHCVTEIGENGLNMINLHFEPRYLWGRSFDSLTPLNTNFCFKHSETFCNCISPDRANALSGFFLMIAEEFDKKRAEYALQIKSLLNMIIINLIRNQGYSPENVTVYKDKYKSIRQAVKYIDAHFSEELTLNILAELSGVTPNYFSSLFHEVSGIPLWDYINSRRIEAAMHLLKSEKSLNILDVAAKCGFNNTANFNKAFKKITGITPKEYRWGGDIII